MKLDKRLKLITRIVAARLQEAESALSSPRSKSPSEIQNLTREILDQPEFKKTVRVEWLQRMIEWLEDHLSGLPVLSSRAFPLVYWLVLILCSAALLTASIYLLRHLSLPSDRPTGISLIQTDPLPIDLLAHQHYLSQASQAASKEEFATALRWLLVALIAFLDEKKIVIYQPGKTNWFYVRSCSSNPGWYPSACVLATLFDRKWYGSEPCSEQEYLEGQQALLQVVGTEEMP